MMNQNVMVHPAIVITAAAFNMNTSDDLLLKPLERAVYFITTAKFLLVSKNFAEIQGWPLHVSLITELNQSVMTVSFLDCLRCDSMA